MRAVVFYPALLIVAWSLPLSGQWNPDPSINTPLCVAPGWQSPAALLADGNRGAFAVWFDSPANGSTGIYDVYAQHILADGVYAWPVNGAKILNDATFYMHFVLVPDGQNGFIIVYEKIVIESTGIRRSISAVRINHRGHVTWRIVRVFPMDHLEGRQFAAISDGAGGVVVFQSFGFENDAGNILAQRIRIDGAHLWPAPGKMICETVGGQYGPQAVLGSDGFYYVAWEDDRNYQTSNQSVEIFMQRVNALGEPTWTPKGLRITGSKDRYGTMKLIANPNGELTAVWVDARMDRPKTATLADDTTAVFAQRITSEGTFVWVGSGVHVSYGMPVDVNGRGDIQSLQIDTDHMSTVTVAWCNNAGMHYAQRLNCAGYRMFRSGYHPCSVMNNLSRSYYRFGMTGDMDGGMFFTYLFEEGAAVYLHALHVDYRGTVDWVNKPVSSASGSKDITFGSILPHMVTDGHGGFLVAWSDGRNDMGDVYIARVQRNGTLIPVELRSFSGVRNETTATLRWQTASETNNRGFDIERSMNEREWEQIGFVEGRGTSAWLNDYVFSDHIAIIPPSAAVYYRLKQTDFDGSYTYSPAICLQAAEIAPEPHLYPVYPNPVRDDARVQFSLPANTAVRFELVNMLGQVLFSYTSEYCAGQHSSTIPAAKIEAGQYVIRLSTPLGQSVQMLIKR